MFKNLVILLTLFMGAQLFAADVLLKAGANNSWFANEGGTSETKPAVGIGVHFPGDDSYKTKFGIDVLYVGQKLVLKDITWPSSFDPIDDCDITSGNMYIHYHYLKLPLYFDSILFHKNSLSIVMNIGLIYSFTLGSSSDADYFQNDIYDCEYDYELINSDVDPAYPIEAMIGTGFNYKRVGFNLIYTYTLSKTKWLVGLKIRDQIHSIRLMMNWYLKQ